METSRTLLIGCTFAEGHVRGYVESHPDEEVYCLDREHKYDAFAKVSFEEMERRITCDFNDILEVHNLVHETFGREYFDKIVFDINVIKFVDDDCIFQFLLVAFNLLLTVGGTLYFECCTWQSFGIDRETGMASFAIMEMVPKSKQLPVLVKYRPNRRDGFENQNNQMMIRQIMHIMREFGFESENVSISQAPYPLKTIDTVWRYIRATKIENVGDTYMMNPRFIVVVSPKPNLITCEASKSVMIAPKVLDILKKEFPYVKHRNQVFGLIPKLPE